MKAIVVTDQAAGTAGMKLVERPEPQAAINEPSTWTDRLGRDRTPVIPGQELAGVVTALGYGTRGLSVGRRVFGLSDSYRGGTLAEVMRWKSLVYRSHLRRRACRPASQHCSPCVASSDVS